MNALRPTDDLFLVDASSFIHRDYHSSKLQDQAYNVNDRGEPIGAVKRFAERLFWWRKRGAHNRVPTHMGMVFDAGRRNWRHEIYPAYKAGRPPLDDDLHVQMPLMRVAAEAMGICAVEETGYEADDLIATYALTAVEQDASCLIISGDKDLLQLVRPGVQVFDPQCGVEGYPGYRPARLFGHDEVVEKFGVPPDLVIDVQGLAGDPGDGVPGVPGIGIKTAAKLVAEFGSLAAVLAAAPEKAAAKKPAAMWVKVAANADLALTSRCLVSLDCCVDYSTPIEAMLLEPFEHDRAIAFAEEIGLPSIVRMLEKDRDYAERRAAA
ncbi:5'-3' exonuclease [Enterovirga rhinocerotis]|uniref:5'-3' exonuclease n=1 Tax=Enterovirga rhinocerotis TaxID=1339210 RepID=A0A4R7BYJ2_9HYPH|nr:5'-3' exonuclease H3TH domain-containing protein [Enterovirga rhinocerotis]TDR90342.1 5'-3' exonuclease [Enterovirga rhinocerotis]